MHKEAVEATYKNLMLLALADGKLHRSEMAYLARFSRAFKLTKAEEKAWQEAVLSGKVSFQAIADSEDAREALGLMARMVRVDGEFDPDEQEAYVAMGKALGFTAEELGPALRAYWDKDPLAGWQTGAFRTTEMADSVVLVISDDIEDPDLVEEAGGNLCMHFGELHATSTLSTTPRAVIFHAAGDRVESANRLRSLKKAFPGVYIAFLARRDQAHQIGWLLEQGANRCFVEPLYPNEIARAIEQS